MDPSLGSSGFGARDYGLDGLLEPLAIWCSSHMDICVWINFPEYGLWDKWFPQTNTSDTPRPLNLNASKSAETTKFTELPSKSRDPSSESGVDQKDPPAKVLVETYLGLIFITAFKKFHNRDSGWTPVSLAKDPFIKGYIFGFVDSATDMVNLRSPPQKRAVLVNVFGKFFPHDGGTIAEDCENLYRSKDSGFLNAVSCGETEVMASSDALKLGLSGDISALTELGTYSLSTLKNHLDDRVSKSTKSSRRGKGSVATTKGLKEIPKTGESTRLRNEMTLFQRLKFELYPETGKGKVIYWVAIGLLAYIFGSSYYDTRQRSRPVDPAALRALDRTLNNARIPEDDFIDEGPDYGPPPDRYNP